MVTGLGFKGAILGMGEESIYGTPVARTKFLEMSSDALAVTEERIHSGAIPSLFTDDDEVCKGAISVAGDMQFEMRFEGFELLLKHGMGGLASVEVATFIVTVSNQWFDFKEDAGAELNASISAGTYKMGSTDADAGTLCALIKTALELAGAGTYAVSFSNTTKKITIAVSGGATNVQFLWKTGTHGSDNLDTHIGTLIGFSDTADSTNTSSHTAGTSVVTAFDHTFTLTDDLPVGLTMEVDRDITAFIYDGCKVNTLGMSIDTGGFLLLNVGIIGQDETTGSVTSATLPTANLVCFVTGVVTYGGSTKNVKSANFTLNNNLSTDRRFIGSRTMSEPQRSAKIEVTGTMTIEFETTAEYDDFRNATSRTLVLTFTELTALKGTIYRTITVTFPIIKLTGKTPTISDAGVIMLELPFKAYATDSATREFNVVVRNTIASV